MKTIQIRNVPEETSRELKVRAALQGKSLSEYTLEVLTEHTQESLTRAVDAAHHGADC